MLFLRDGNLMAQPFDETRLELTRSPVPIAAGVDIYRDGATMSVSENGVLVYRTAASLQLQWLDRQGRPAGTLAERGRYLTLTLSPNGARALVSKADPQNVGRRNLWLFDFSRGETATRFSPNGDEAVWSPDSRQVIYGTAEGVRRQALDGTQPETLVPTTTAAGRRSPTSWSPDGRFVLHTVNNLKTNSDLWTLTLGATPTVQPFLELPASESQGQFSPTARPLLVAYTSNESGRDEVFVRTFPDGGNRQAVSINGGHSPRWSGDGRELFYVAADGTLMAVPFTESGPGIPVSLFAVPAGFASRDATTSRAHAPWGVTPDGQRFLFAAPAAASEANGFTVVLNWHSALTD